MAHSELETLRAYWDAYVPVFEQFLEPSTALLARTLLSHLRLREARAVLEVGSGPGAAALLLHDAVPQGARVVATDLSPAMVARARERLPAAIEVREANCEALPYEAGTFDRLLANLILMLTPDPDRALAELHRVLSPGAIAAWSVWGRSEHSPMFTLPIQAARRVGLALPATRSNFHLGDRDALRARVARHGFEHVLAWYQAMVPDWHDAERYTELTLRTPRWHELLAGQPEPRLQALREELTKLANEHLASGSPLGLDVLVVIARRA